MGVQPLPSLPAANATDTENIYFIYTEGIIYILFYFY